MRTPATRRLVLSDQPEMRKVKPQETPRARFLRIAPDRVGKAVEAMRHCAQLANRAVYDATPADYELIGRTLQEELDQLKYVLANPGKTIPVIRFSE